MIMRGKVACAFFAFTIITSTISTCSFTSASSWVKVHWSQATCAYSSHNYNIYERELVLLPGRSLSDCLKQMTYISKPRCFTVSLVRKKTVKFPDWSWRTKFLEVVFPHNSVLPPGPRSIKMLSWHLYRIFVIVSHSFMHIHFGIPLQMQLLFPSISMVVTLKKASLSSPQFMLYWTKSWLS